MNPFNPENWFIKPTTTGYALAWTALICLALFVTRLLGPADLMDDDQQRPAAYVMDIVRNGNWVVQRDQSGNVMSKPPLSTWITALITIPFDRVNQPLLYLPCALATLLIAWLILAAGVCYFGHGAGLLGAVIYLLSMVAFKQIALLRTDSLFALLVFLGALAALRAWNRQSGWTLFWLIAAAATLTKGPLGVVLSLGGLWACLWEKRDGARRPLRGSHVGGILLFLALTLGWFFLAYCQCGRELVDKMIGRELIGHAVRSDGGTLPLIKFYIPSFYFLSRFAPWSLLSLLGFWRIWRRPASSADERLFERFLFCYFFSGLILFSLAPHHRPDHLWPLIPAAALVGGREAARLWRPRSPRQLRIGLAVGLLGFLILGNLYLHLVRNRDEKVVETRRIREIARDIRQAVGSEFPLIHVDSPYGLQFYLNTMRRNISPERATQALAHEQNAYAVVSDPKKLMRLLPPNIPLYEVARWETANNKRLVIVSNHPRLEYTPKMATVVGPILVQMDGLHLRRSASGELLFWARQPSGKLMLTNQSGLSRSLQVKIRNARPEIDHQIVLASGDTWNEDFGRSAGPQSVLRIAQLADCRDGYAQLDWLSRGKAFVGIDYLFINGDFVFESDWRYDLFLKQASRLSVPFFPILGNHDRVISSDYPAESFLNRMGYQLNAFDDGPARFILLDSSRGEIDDHQFEFLGDQLKTSPRASRRILFQHVPPDHLDTKHFLPFGATGRAGDCNRLLQMAARGKVDRLYCAHVNGLRTRDYKTSSGTVRVVVSSGGGEKGGKTYRQHWLEMKISAAKIQEIPHDIPPPKVWTRFASKLRLRIGFFAPRLLPVALLFFGLGFLLVLAARFTIHFAQPIHHDREDA